MKSVALPLRGHGGIQMVVGGKAVSGSRTGRPVMRLLDLLGRRWALRVLWELRTGPLAFRALREASGDLSPSVLNDRLRELREAGLVELREREGYALTPQALELSDLLLPLDAWARRWARRGNAPKRSPQK